MKDTAYQNITITLLQIKIMSLISEADVIVVQNDENANDFDGISGTPMSATLLNAAGVQDKTTFF